MLIARELTVAAISGTMAALCLLAGCTTAADVEVRDVDVPFELSGTLQGVGEVSYKQELASDGESFLLLPTFDDRAAALEGVKGEASDAVALLESRCPWLGPLSAGNWAAYRDELNASFDGLCDGSARDDQLALLRGFFDIYENDDENASLIAHAQHEGLDAVRPELPGQPAPRP